jgi:hypothetical protein
MDGEPQTVDRGLSPAVTPHSLVGQKSFLGRIAILSRENQKPLKEGF